MGAAGGALAPAGPGALVPLKMALASADSVGNDVYVAVVVDFGSGSGMSTIAKCVPVASAARDSDALAAAVGVNNVSYSNSGLLCAIDNYPANGVQSCGQSVGAGEYDYWSYWHGASGSWVYANDGPAEHSVSSPADDVEGWRFQVGQPDNTDDPPPAVQASYAQICNAASEVAPSQPATPSVTTTTPAPPSANTTTTGSANAAGGTIPATTTPTTGTGNASSDTAISPATTSTAATTSPARQGTASRTGATGGHGRAQASARGRQGSGGSGSAFLPIVLVGVLVAVLGGLAVIRWRRRPGEE